MKFDENGKAIPENLHEVDMFNQFQRKKWRKEIEEMAAGDKNEEILLKVALLKAIQDDKRKEQTNL